MSIDVEKFKKDLEEWTNSDDGKAYFENLRKKNEIRIGRYRRFESYLETHDFDRLMYRLILEHGKEWREKCWHNGCEAHPNNKLGFIIDYVVHNVESVDVPQIESEHFPTQTWFFKGYYFQLMFGQGTAFFLYNSEDFKCVLQA